MASTALRGGLERGPGPGEELEGDREATAGGIPERSARSLRRRQRNCVGSEEGEHCDLSGDGFDDPIFLWDASLGTLHVRLLLVVGNIETIPVVRRADTVLFLRNGAGS